MPANNRFISTIRFTHLYFIQQFDFHRGSFLFAVLWSTVSSIVFRLDGISVAGTSVQLFEGSTYCLVGEAGGADILVYVSESWIDGCWIFGEMPWTEQNGSTCMRVTFLAPPIRLYKQSVQVDIQRGIILTTDNYIRRHTYCTLTPLRIKWGGTVQCHTTRRRSLMHR